MVLNEFKTQQITWDKATKQFHEKIEANSGDTNGRKLKVQIINNSLVENLTGVTLNLAWRTKDNSNFGLDVFKVIDATKGIFEILYTTEMLSNVKKLKASLVMIDSTGRTESNEFDIDVKPSVVNDGSVQSQNSFTALTSALVKVNEWNGRIDAVEQDYADRAEALEQTYAPKLTEVTAKLAKKANDDEVRKKNVLIGLNDADSELLGAIQNKEGETTFELLSIPKDKSVTTDSLDGVLFDKINEISPNSKYIANSFDDEIKINTENVDKINPRTKSLQLPGFKGWSGPFTYGGESFYGIYHEGISSSADAYVTFSVHLQGERDNPIMTSEKFMKAGEVYRDLVVPLLVKGLEVNSIYYLSIFADRPTSLAVDGYSGVPKGEGYLSPIDTILYPSFHNLSTGQWVQSVDKDYQLAVSFIKEEEVAIDPIKSIIEDHMTSEIEGVKDYEKFKKDVIQYNSMPVYNYDPQGIREPNTKKDGYDFITAYSAKLDKTKIDPFNYVKGSFSVAKPQSDSTYGTIHVYVNDSLNTGLIVSAIASGKVEVDTKGGRTNFTVTLDKTVIPSNFANNLIISYYYLNDSGKLVAIMAGIADENIATQIATYFGRDGNMQPTSIHTGNIILDLDLGVATDTGETEVTTRVGNYFPVIPKNKIEGMGGEVKIRTFLPSEVACVVGETYELFLDSVIVAKDQSNYHSRYDGVLTGAMLYGRKLYIPEVTADSGGSGTIVFEDDYGNVVAEQPTTIVPYNVINPAEPKNLLVIGDSLTDRNRTMNTLAERLTSSGVTNLNLLGTRGATGKHEGRSGWNILLYNGAGSETLPNPFWNPATNDIDFKKYCADNGYSGLDYVIVHLNWNTDYKNTQKLVEDYETFCNKILRDYPNSKVFIVSLSGYSYNKYSPTRWNSTTKHDVFNLSEEMQAMTDKYVNMETIHLLHQKDEEYAPTTINLPVNTRNPDVTENVTGDHVHVSNVGYDQIADGYYRELIAQLNKDNV